jgi:hypothetical protein
MKDLYRMILSFMILSLQLRAPNFESVAVVSVSCFVALALWLVGNIAFAQTASLPPKEKFHLFLLAGQSNMAGRGTVTPQDKTPHPRVLMLNQAGEWVPAVDPMHSRRRSIRHIASCGAKCRTPPSSAPRV